MATPPLPNPQTIPPDPMMAQLPEPPITPPTQGFGAWASDPRNMAKVAPYLVPQPGAPGVDTSGVGGALFGDNAPQPATKPIDLGMPSVSPPTMEMDRANAPDAYGQPYLKNGQPSKWQRVAAALM